MGFWDTIKTKEEKKPLLDIPFVFPNMQTGGETTPASRGVPEFKGFALPASEDQPRREVKDTVISQGTLDKPQGFFAPLFEGLFGQRDAVHELAPEGTDKGLVGFVAPFLSKTETENVLPLYQSLVDNGIDTKRATDLAVKAMRGEVGPTSSGLSLEERKAITLAQAKTSAGVAFDVASNIPGFGVMGKLGNKADDAFRVIAKTQDVGQIEKVLSELVPDVADTTLARQLVGVTDAGEIRNIVDQAVADRAVLRGAKGLPDQAPRGSSTGVPSQSKLSQTVPDTGFSPSSLNQTTDVGKLGKAGSPNSTRYVRPSFSRNLVDEVPIQEYVTTTRRAAQENLSTFTRNIEDVTGFKPLVRVKAEDSLMGKVERTLTEGRSREDINDILGSRIITPLIDAEATIAKIGEGFDVKRVKNYFKQANEYGYRGANVVVQLPGDGLAEIQVHTPNSLKIVNKIHPIYEKWRGKDISMLTHAEKVERSADLKRSNEIASRLMSQPEDTAILSKRVNVGNQVTAKPNQIGRAGRLVGDLVPPKGVDIPPPKGGAPTPKINTISLSGTVPQKFKAVFTNVVEYVQNSEERVRQLTARKDLNTATDPYEIMTLYHGRVGKKIEEGYQRAEEIADDIISFSGRNKTDVINGRQEVNDYLQALHAGERNLAHGEGAAGMTTAEATEILKKASPEVKAVAKKALDLNNKTLDLLKDSGVITPELHTTLRTKYKNHVPLQRVMDEQDDIGAVLSGRGFDVRSTGVKTAKGSARQVADILTNITNNYEQAVLRSEKNIVDRATLTFVRNNADDLKNIARVRKPRAIGTRFDTPRKVEELKGMEWETPFTAKEVDDALGQAEMEVLTQMELSTAGERIILPHDATRAEGNVLSVRSTFPDWVPEHLRSKDLFDKVIDQYNKGIPQRGGATKQKELYDIMQAEIASRVPMDVRDEMALTEIAKQSEIRASLITKVQAKKGATIFESTNDPKVLQLFEEGKPVWIEFKDEKLAIAFRGVGREKLGVLLNAVGSFTRFYSGLATRFNPEFALPNKIRDLQETMTYLASQGDVGFKGAVKTALVDPASMKAVLDGVRGADTPGAKLYNEMRSLGGTTGGMGLSTRKQTQLNIDKIFNIARSRPRKATQKIIEYVDNWNTVFEDSTRLSVYKTALDRGATKERAAFLAKEASINFNRSGRGGPVLNALWMFSNASIQGSTKMIRAMKNPKVLATVSATMAGSVAALSEWNDRVDPEWRDKVTKWDRINGLSMVLPTEDGSTRYVVIPVSWGLKPILVMANAAYDSISGIDVDPLDATQRVLSAFLDAYNPVGGTDITSAITPTILDAPSEVARNQSWSGSLIRPIPYGNEPKDIQYFQSLADTEQGRLSIATTKKLQENYGLLVSPADVDYVITQYIGGAGRSIKKTGEVLFGATTDAPMPPADEWPFVSRFLRQRTSEETGQGAGGEIEKLKSSLSDQARERFRKNEEAEAMYKTMKDLPKEVAAERFSVLKETNPDLADKIVDIAKDEAKGLTYEDKLVKALGVENGERARYLFEQFTKAKSAEAKAQLWDEYQTKGLLTKEVAKQLRYLLNQ